MFISYNGILIIFSIQEVKYHCYIQFQGSVDIINSTLGKALGGAAGGYTTGTSQLVTLLRQRSRYTGAQIYGRTLGGKRGCSNLS